MKQLVDDALARDGILTTLDAAAMADAEQDFRATARFDLKATKGPGDQTGERP